MMKMIGEVPKMTEAIKYISVFLLILVSAFFSATEIAYSSVNAVRLKAKKQNGETFALKTAIKILDKYDSLLSTILIGNNIANSASSAIATLIVINIFGSDDYTWVSTVVMTLLVLTFGEIIPKTLARVFPERFAMFACYPMKVLVFVLKPITVLFGKFDEKVSDMVDEEEKVTATEDELIDIVEKIEKEGVLEHQESELIQSAITFDSKSVRNVMTPKEEVKYVNIDDSFDRVAKFFQYHQYSRVPVYDKEKDLIVGVINQKDVYSFHF